MTRDEMQDVWKHWNSKEGIWKKCRFFNNTVIDSIRDGCNAVGDVENIMIAIDNYHLVLNSEDVMWTYKWSLSQFMCQHRPKSQHKLANRQIIRFLEYEDGDLPKHSDGVQSMGCSEDEAAEALGL